MLKITLTEYSEATREEALKKLVDSKYVICYDEDKSKNTIFCKSKDELFATLEKDHEDITIILELYNPLVDKNSISFLTKDFEQDN